MTPASFDSETSTAPSTAPAEIHIPSLITWDYNFYADRPYLVKEQLGLTNRADNKKLDLEWAKFVIDLGITRNPEEPALK